MPGQGRARIDPMSAFGVGGLEGRGGIGARARHPSGQGRAARQCEGVDVRSGQQPSVCVCECRLGSRGQRRIAQVRLQTGQGYEGDHGPVEPAQRPFHPHGDDYLRHLAGDGRSACQDCVLPGLEPPEPGAGSGLFQPRRGRSGEPFRGTGQRAGCGQSSKAVQVLKTGNQGVEPRTAGYLEGFRHQGQKHYAGRVQSRPGGGGAPLRGPLQVRAAVGVLAPERRLSLKAPEDQQGQERDRQPETQPEADTPESRGTRSTSRPSGDRPAEPHQGVSPA